jgi:CRP-like cAMP-binding protein
MRSGYRNAIGAASNNRQAPLATSVARREQKFIKPVPFNGLLTNKLLSALPGDAFTRLLPYLEPVSLACGENIYEPGETAQFNYFPENAVISHYYAMSNGSTTEAAMIGKEGMTGLSAIFNARPPAFWTHVTLAGNALRIRTDVLREEFNLGGSLQSLLLVYASARLAQATQRVVCNGQHTMQQRLCSWLLMLHDRVGDDYLSLTHEQIAHHLGTRRAGISEIATALRRRGDISYSRGLIHILNRQGLESVACECYKMLTQ